jgi:hypothetical protein
VGGGGDSEALTMEYACNRPLPQDELARIAAALQSGDPHVPSYPLTPSHSLHGERSAPTPSPPLPSDPFDVSSLALNHMPRTPHTPPSASETAEQSRSTDAANSQPSDSQMQLQLQQGRALWAATTDVHAQEKAPSRLSSAQAAAEVAGFLGAVTNSETSLSLVYFL